jgi:hypothetical protein
MNKNRLKSDDKSFETLLKGNLLDEIQIKLIRCKSCGMSYSIEDVSVTQKFWTCGKCSKPQKYSDNNISLKSYWALRSMAFNKRVSSHLKKCNYELVAKFDQFYVLYKSQLIPVIILEFASQSELLDATLANSIIIYCSDLLYTKNANVITKGYFISAGDFFLLNELSLVNLLEVVSKTQTLPRLFEVKSRIDKYALTKSWGDFEAETQKLFDELKNKRTEINRMLQFYKMNNSNPLGSKFVHVGGNYQVDVEVINLYQYLSELIDFSESSTGIDAKRYTKTLSLQVYEDKTRTNRGRSVIFVTNQHKISPKVWEQIFISKSQHTKWYDFIIDLEILSILVYFLDLNDLYNSNPSQPTS